MKRIVERFGRVIDLVLLPFIYPAGAVLRLARELGMQRLPLSRKALRQVGVMPIRDHYYDPQFDFGPDELDGRERSLPGIDFNRQAQLQTLETFTHADEIRSLAKGFDVNGVDFSFDNGSYEAGDAEIWFQLIRSTKPRRIIEIGSGNSTLVAVEAIRRNQADDPTYRCDHVCIEPYEMPWLEKTPVTVKRMLVEHVELSFFEQLGDGDVLFIDSSHVIRPEGDVVVEYLQILPTLAPGVVVHVHDIFTPRNYPESLLRDKVLFWNEQYVLEAFLTHNDSWDVVLALNYLQHNEHAALSAACPLLGQNHEPGAFYLRRT